MEVGLFMLEMMVEELVICGLEGVKNDGVHGLDKAGERFWGLERKTMKRDLCLLRLSQQKVIAETIEMLQTRFSTT